MRKGRSRGQASNRLLSKWAAVAALNAVRLSSSGRASPYSYGSIIKMPLPQERVPRSIQRSFTSRSKLARLPLFPQSAVLRSGVGPRLAKRSSVGVRPTLSSSKVGRLFKFRSPFYRQYAQMRSVGRMVAHPEKVGFCLKRKIKREVLFAFRLAGFKGSAPGRRRTYRRNDDSSHGC